MELLRPFEGAAEAAPLQDLDPWDGASQAVLSTQALGEHPDLQRAEVRGHPEQPITSAWDGADVGADLAL